MAGLSLSELFYFYSTGIHLGKEIKMSKIPKTLTTSFCVNIYRLVVRRSELDFGAPPLKRPRFHFPMVKNSADAKLFSLIIILKLFSLIGKVIIL
jgi:hypothetical protein